MSPEWSRLVDTTIKAYQKEQEASRKHRMKVTAAMYPDPESRKEFLKCMRLMMKLDGVSPKARKEFIKSYAAELEAIQPAKEGAKCPKIRYKWKGREGE